MEKRLNPVDSVDAVELLLGTTLTSVITTSHTNCHTVLTESPFVIQVKTATSQAHIYVS